MIKVVREIKYSNGKIAVTNRFDNIEIMVVKEDKIVEIKEMPLTIFENKVMLDNIMSSLKSSHGLMFVEDDYTTVLSASNKRYMIRGTGSAIHVNYSQDGSSFIKQMFLPYNYKDVSLNDYMNMFGYS